MKYIKGFIRYLRIKLLYRKLRKLSYDELRVIYSHYNKDYEKEVIDSQGTSLAAKDFRFFVFLKEADKIK